MLTWDPALNTGNDDIDRQHREIFARLNGIETAINDGVDHESLMQLINALLDYAYIHFHHEEHAMNCSRCPFHDTNCRAHREFILRLRNWLILLEGGGAEAQLLREIHAESCHWIKSHIEQVDSGLRPQPAAGPEPVPAA